MSRRTKLLITAVCLVLLGMVAVYAAALWTVKEPLRVRLVKVSAPEKGVPPHADWKLTRCEIEVRNTSSFPITLKNIFVYHGTHEDEVWIEYEGRKFRRSFDLREGVSIGGHKSARFHLCYTYPGEAGDITVDPWEFTYLWELPAIRRWNGLLARNAPGVLARHLPSYEPSYDVTTLAFESTPESKELKGEFKR